MKNISTTSNVFMMNNPYIITKKKQIRTLLTKLTTLKTSAAREKVIQRLNNHMNELRRINRKTERQPIAYIASRTIQSKNTKVSK